MNQINVQAKEIHEWLVLRRKLDKYWGQQHKAIKLKQEKILKKIKTDLKNLEKVTKFFTSIKSQEEKEINYINLLKLEKILINSEEGKKRNFFNQYSSQYIKDLQALVKIYKKKFIHIASLAQELNQKINHELPGMKKVLKNNVRLIKDFEFKSSSYESSIRNSKKEILKLVEKYVPEFELKEEGIDNFDLEMFLKDFVFEISPRIDQIVELSSGMDLEGVIAFYKEFAFYTNEDVFEEDYFQLLIDLKKKGHYNLEGDKVKNCLEIYLNSKGYYKGKKEEEEIIEIDWEIEDIGENSEKLEKKNLVKKREISKNTNLTDRKTREKILQLLYELYYFYKIRLKEVKKGLMHETDQEIINFNRKMNLEKISKILEKFEKLIFFFTERQFNLILSILENPRNKQKIKSNFEKFFNLIQKNNQKISFSKKKILDLKNEIISTRQEMVKSNQKSVMLRGKIADLMKEEFGKTFIISMPFLSI